VIQRFAWLLAQGAIVAWYLSSEAEGRFVIVGFAIVLSFPAGLAVAYPVAGLASLGCETRDVWLTANRLIWVGAVAAGYWQWFVLLPRLRAARAARRWRRDAGQLGGPGNPWPRD